MDDGNTFDMYTTLTTRPIDIHRSTFRHVHPFANPLGLLNLTNS